MICHVLGRQSELCPRIFVDDVNELIQSAHIGQPFDRGQPGFEVGVFVDIDDDIRLDLAAQLLLAQVEHQAFN